MNKLPGYMIEFQIAIEGVKKYTGWTDQQLADRLGVSITTVQSAKRDPCAVNGGIILRIQDMLREYRKKAGMI